MKRVITYGTFDLFHYGHLRILERAKQLGDYLIVGISTENFNRIKNKECVYPYEQRAQIVSAIKYVDLVIAEETWEQKESDIKKYKVDILVMGDDWQGKFDELAKICKVIYLPRTPNVSSTEIKKNCHDSVKKGL
jgi:glycerol-3-phosphate cytidylyltransferase